MYVGHTMQNYRTSYHTEFPAAEIARVPVGWHVLFINKHRRGCPDECWRLVLKRNKPII